MSSENTAWLLMSVVCVMSVGYVILYLLGFRNVIFWFLIAIAVIDCIAWIMLTLDVSNKDKIIML